MVLPLGGFQALGRVSPEEISGRASWSCRDGSPSCLSRIGSAESKLAEPGSLGYGTPPAPFFYDATGLDYFGARR